VASEQVEGGGEEEGDKEGGEALLRGGEALLREAPAGEEVASGETGSLIWFTSKRSLSQHGHISRDASVNSPCSSSSS
jgi:hypothetical protein